MTPLRSAFLALAAWGTVHPLYWFTRHMRETGTGLAGVIEAWDASASTIGLRWDVTIAALTLTVWAAAEAWARRDWVRLLAVPATIGIGLSCGLPLYLFLRSRRGADGLASPPPVR